MEDHPKEKAPKEEPKAREEPKAWEEPKGKDPKVKEDAQGPLEVKMEVQETKMVQDPEAMWLPQVKIKASSQLQEVRIQKLQKRLKNKLDLQR